MFLIRHVQTSSIRKRKWYTCQSFDEGKPNPLLFAKKKTKNRRRCRVVARVQVKECFSSCSSFPSAFNISSQNMIRFHLFPKYPSSLDAEHTEGVHCKKKTAWPNAQTTQVTPAPQCITSRGFVDNKHTWGKTRNIVHFGPESSNYIQ